MNPYAPAAQGTRPIPGPPGHGVHSFAGQPIPGQAMAAPGMAGVPVQLITAPAAPAPCLSAPAPHMLAAPPVVRVPPGFADFDWVNQPPELVTISQDALVPETAAPAASINGTLADLFRRVETCFHQGFWHPTILDSMGRPDCPMPVQRWSLGHLCSAVNGVNVPALRHDIVRIMILPPGQPTVIHAYAVYDDQPFSYVRRTLRPGARDLAPARGAADAPARQWPQLRHDITWCRHPDGDTVPVLLLKEATRTQEDQAFSDEASAAVDRALEKVGFDLDYAEYLTQSTEHCADIRDLIAAHHQEYSRINAQQVGFMMACLTAPDGKCYLAAACGGNGSRRQAACHACMAAMVADERPMRTPWPVSAILTLLPGLFQLSELSLDGPTPARLRPRARASASAAPPASPPRDRSRRRGARPASSTQPRSRSKRARSPSRRARALQAPPRRFRDGGPRLYSYHDLKDGEGFQEICIGWNNRRCSAGGPCEKGRLHLCSRCLGDHRKLDCTVPDKQLTPPAAINVKGPKGLEAAIAAQSKSGGAPPAARRPKVAVKSAARSRRSAPAKPEPKRDRS